MESIRELNKRIVLFACLTLGFLSGASGQNNYSQYVDPMIGTGGHGHTYPGATVPFGMVQISPDTRIDGSWDGCSGYHYSDSVIYGFSHTHLNGTGCSDYGDIVIMPFVGKPSIDINDFKSKFSHTNEKAAAGSYFVKLDNNIEVELTSTIRAGFHKYKFPANSQANIVIDLSLRDKTLQSSLDSVSPTRLEGMRESEGWAKDQHIYFVIEFSSPFQVALSDNPVGMIADGEGFSRSAIGDKMCLSFSTKENPVVMLKVGISTVSIDGARRNLKAEIEGWDFEKVKNDAQSQWNSELGKIEASGKDKDKLKIFYTALYHTMIQPNVNMDVDGMYRGRDNKIHKAEGFTNYSVFSLWDTFRAAHPLYALIDKERTADFINTFLVQFDQGGRLPVWELAGNETDCMIGYHAVSVIADAMVKGIKGFDYEKAFEASKHSAMLNHPGLKAYKQNGFISMDDEHESVSKTLEYAYDDWCIAQMAELLKKSDDHHYFMERSQSWKNLFDPSTGFMRPKKNGGWLSPFDAREVNNNFTEGNSWQYSFFVPQDVPGLITMMGGSNVFERKLDELFSTSDKTTGREQVDITGLIGQYAQGNEPSHHMTYLYTYINKPYKTQELLHRIMKEFYKSTPGGLIGNEDCGQMSAWYVLNAIGMYSVIPGSGKFELGAPVFDQVKIHLENGKMFQINASDLSDSNFYVQNYLLNNQPYRKTFIEQAVIEEGGIFSFGMSAVPSHDIFENTVSGKIPVTDLVTPVPVINASSMVFDDSLIISLNEAHQKDTIYYYVTGKNSNAPEFKLYNKPFSINATKSIVAYAESNKIKSDTISATFYQRPNRWRISILSKYNPQYTAGGDLGIIDGLNGTENWRKGDWQGYQAQNFVAVVDLTKVQEITSVSSEYLQDTRSWILFPTKVRYSFSEDGVNFKDPIEIVNNIDPANYDIQIKKFSKIPVSPLNARYVKVEAMNFGKLPEWHQGAGDDAFIFIDEIEIR